MHELFLRSRGLNLTIWGKKETKEQQARFSELLYLTDLCIFDDEDHPYTQNKIRATMKEANKTEDGKKELDLFAKYIEEQKNLMHRITTYTAMGVKDKVFKGRPLARNGPQPRQIR